MPKLAAPLTDIQARNAKPKDRPYKLADGGGMYLEVMPTGAKLWRMKYRQVGGKENRLTFGPYPETTLAETRDKRAEARKLLTDGIDPAKHRDDTRRIAAEKSAHTFEKVARDWHQNKITAWSANTAANTLHRLEQDIFPAIGAIPISPSNCLKPSNEPASLFENAGFCFCLQAVRWRRTFSCRPKGRLSAIQALDWDAGSCSPCS